MKKHLVYIIFGLMVMAQNASAQLLPNLGGQRVGISTLTFLKTDISPRSMALSGANLTLSADGMSAFHNPALMAQNERLHFTANDLVVGAGVHQAWLSSILPLKKSNSAFGASLNYFSSGAMKVRTEFQPTGTGELFYANQFAAGLSYSKALSDRFSFGANLKFVHERLAQYTNSTLAVDLGFLYTTDVKDFKFGIVVKNFGGNSSLSGDFLSVNFNRNAPTLDQYNVPTAFKLGASAKPIEKDDHSVLVAVQLEHPNDNSENIRLGVEYDFKELLFARIGYKINVLGENLPTLGVGYRATLKKNTVMVNYAVNPTQYLGTLHLFGLDFGINNDKR
ncbi:MAG: PorV/PorQ family protein [Salibacteraceae bacterium]|nr:PorV/PorQ family protein [Salibacteraceae bacterium]MDP4686418.1 PorV/PorQ family protein [Salibacteraceae bacterium]MDP4762234.1 PorV/PorQ family protein [Salibacteraceae bacterium]MDP4844051.1 PorV/PorQ family protein [Salibacteraceae bacterium]MDP4933274.1 PorV/PorQ family protein [Salibacteraceae bacterium]